MERRYPKIGKLALLISLSQFLGVLLNGILGVFPAGIIGTGGRGQKFHLLQYLRQSFDLPYKENGFWSDAGVLTGQEYAMILLMLVTLVIAVFGLRQRPAIDGPKKMDSETQREQLETGQVSVSRPGGLSVVNPTTAAIVSQIVGGESAPTADIISNALGEMSAVAQEMGVDDFLVKGQIISDVRDNNSIIGTSLVSTSVEEDDDVIDLTVTVSQSEEMSPIESVTSLQPSIEENDEDLGWLDDVEVTTSSPTKISVQDSALTSVTSEPAKVTTNLPSLPNVTKKSDIGDTSPVTNILPVSPPKASVDSAFVKPMNNSSTLSSGSGARPSGVREAASGVMPNRPSQLPKMAEYDTEMGAWTLFGKKIEFTDSPPPAPPQAKPVEAPPPIYTKAQSTSSNPPALPTIPTPPPKHKSNLPKLPSIPQI